jgi:hypothetical protein
VRVVPISLGIIGASLTLMASCTWSSPARAWAARLVGISVERVSSMSWMILVACMLFMPGGIVSALDARGGRRAS